MGPCVRRDDVLIDGAQQPTMSSLRKQGPIATGFRGYGRCRPSCATRGHGVWVPAFAGTTC